MAPPEVASESLSAFATPLALQTNILGFDRGDAVARCRALRAPNYLLSQLEEEGKLVLSAFSRNNEAPHAKGITVPQFTLVT